MLIGIIDKDEHLRRRRAWNRAFSTAAVKNHRELVASRVRLLVESLEEQGGEVFLGRWMEYFSYVFTYVQCCVSQPHPQVRLHVRHGVCYSTLTDDSSTQPLFLQVWWRL